MRSVARNINFLDIRKAGRVQLTLVRFGYEIQDMMSEVGICCQNINQRNLGGKSLEPYFGSRDCLC